MFSDNLKQFKPMNEVRSIYFSDEEQKRGPQVQYSSKEDEESEDNMDEFNDEEHLEKNQNFEYFLLLNRPVKGNLEVLKRSALDSKDVFESPYFIKHNVILPCGRPLLQEHEILTPTSKEINEIFSFNEKFSNKLPDVSRSALHEGSLNLLQNSLNMHEEIKLLDEQEKIGKHPRHTSKKLLRLH